MYILGRNTHICGQLFVVVGLSEARVTLIARIKIRLKVNVLVLNIPHVTDDIPRRSS